MGGSVGGGGSAVGGSVGIGGAAVGGTGGCSRGLLVLVGGRKTRVGVNVKVDVNVAVGVLVCVLVGEAVAVNVEGAVVTVAVGELVVVGVGLIVEVTVAEPPPVFGMMKSPESTITGFETRVMTNGRLHAAMPTTRMTPYNRQLLVFTSGFPFYSEC